MLQTVVSLCRHRPLARERWSVAAPPANPPPLSGWFSVVYAYLYLYSRSVLVCLFVVCLYCQKKIPWIVIRLISQQICLLCYTLFSMLVLTYYAQNYASIMWTCSPSQVSSGPQTQSRAQTPPSHEEKGLANNERFLGCAVLAVM